LPPAAPDSAAGRQFDYQTGYNMQSRPRSGESVGFDQMRALADGYDLLRLVIETRKDQICKLQWTIKPRDVAGTLGDESAKQDPRCEALVQFFRKPDRENNWETWLRMLLEDLLVLDAPTIYPRMTNGGALYALEPLDGATIKRVIDHGGRTPIDGPAYQQVLKGVAATDYARGELFYLPRNRRTHKIYGYSPVEQIITTVNLALRRQLHLMSYYTDGSTPDLIFTVPAEWQPAQIKQFQEWWNLLLQGNIQGRRGTMFVPHGVSPVNTKEQALKNEFDEWLARVVCFAFSVSPQPFIKEMNRATAETGQNSALSEGLAPLMQWVKSMMDDIIAQFAAPDLEFIWKNTESIKPKEQAEIDKIYVDANILTADEVRAKRFGLSAKPKEEQPALPDKSGDSANDPEQTDKVAKASKKTSGLTAIDRDRAIVVDTANALSSDLAAWLAIEAPLLAADVVAARDALSKADGDSLINRILSTITFGRWKSLSDLFGKRLAIVAKDGAEKALIQVGIDDATEQMLNQINERAVEWANDRAAEMVGMRVENGELVVNPNPEYAITEATREGLRSTVTQAINEGWSNDRLAEAIVDHESFGADRADLVARTETAMADIEGNQIAYEESELVEGKQWLTAAGCCSKCAALNRKIVPLDAYFVVGSFRKNPPLHPRCRCDMLPVLIPAS
jgi:hypothetical protein